MTTVGIETAMAAKKPTAALTTRVTAAGIGRRIREVRGAVSQDVFSKLIGLKRRTLVRYEAEETFPTADTLAAICAEFNVDPIWLLLGLETSAFGTIPPTSRTLRRSA